MNKDTVYCGGATPAMEYARIFLMEAGVICVREPGLNVRHLLLDIPSFAPAGKLRSGGNLDTLLASLPRDVKIYGGNLDHPNLTGYACIDFLQNEEYLAKNAAITADCALQVAAAKMSASFRDTPALIIGWGRIGKCLGQLLASFGGEITIAARKEADRAMIRALGWKSADPKDLKEVLHRVRLVFNTVPFPVISEDGRMFCENCLMIDLASQKGILGSDVIWARGLPGVYAPESSGKLIARTFLDLWRKERL